jgi:hypothetical protein
MNILEAADRPWGERHYKMLTRRGLVVALVGLLATLATRTFAQNSFGTILGTVVDQSGAAIVGAPVQIKNAATGVVTTVQTQSDGVFTAINLIPGAYSVSVVAPGFEMTEVPDVVLTVNQKLRVNLSLHAGSVNQTVSVSANGALIDSDSPAITTDISSQQIGQMPLPSRNFMQLLVLSPGTLDAGATLNGEQTLYRTALSGGSTFVGGGRGASNQYLLDGVDNNDPGFQTPAITPSIDAIQGIRLMNKNYSAEYGGSSSQVNIGTKSGTNEYHGTLYEFFRNDALDATDYFATKDPVTGRAKPVLRYNQFGGSVGGPLSIPKVVSGHDKLFFFFNYEGTRTHELSSARGLFPTAAELSGDFSADPIIYDPTTGRPFPGNIIPSVDPKAAQIISLGVIPVANVAPQPGYNTVKTLTLPDNIDQYVARVDARITPKDSLFVRFSASSEDQQIPTIDPYGGQVNTQSAKNLGVDYTRSVSPNLVNDFKVGLNRPITNRTQAGAFGKDIAGSLFNGVDSTSATYGMTSIGFSQYSSIGSGNGPLTYTTTNAGIADNVTFIHGAHTVEVGADVRKIFYKEINAYEPRGIIQFSGLFTQGPLNATGNALADFVLGLPYTATVNQGNYTGWYNAYGENGFAQDDWKLNPKLTMNFGVRYEYLAPFQEEHDRVSTFDPTFPGGRLLTPNAAAVTAVDSPLIGLTRSRNIVNPDRNNWAPRVGFAYRPLTGTVWRGGYGIFYDTVEYNEYVFPVLNPPFQKTAAAVGSVSSPVALDSLFPIAATPQPVPGSIVSLTLTPNSRTPYVQQWNLDFERELVGHSVFELGYLGSEASKLHYRRQAAQGILNDPGPNATITVPYSNFLVILEDTTGASSNYNALVARFEKKFDKGYSLLTHYTFSKSMGTSSAASNLGTTGNFAQNAWDQRADYGELAYDVTHNFVLSGIWDLPFGIGSSYANHVSNLANLLVSGWQLSGIYQAHSGFPFQIGAVSVSGTVSENPRADVVGNPRTKDPVDPTRAFNRYAFAQPAPNTFGNSRIDAVRGKGLSNTDISLFKVTHLNERLAIELRADAYNIFNNAQIGPFPGNQFSLDPSSSFGVYQSLQHEARILQLACRFVF